MRPRPSIARDPAALARRLAGPEGLTRLRSTFTRRDVVQAFAEAARDGATVPRVEAQADAFLARDSIVPLKAVAGERRFTTRELLGVERGALERAERQTRITTGVADEAALDAAMATRTSLSDEQRDLVEALTRGGRGIDVIRAPAGTGKTFALDAAREAWRRSGVPVLGCALSARAACELRDQAGIDATTIARLSHALDRGVQLQHRSVLIVDEAGMVGTRDLARLALAAETASAKLVLVGDDRQLPEIQAGGLFAALADRLGALELREVRRQREAWDRDALSALRRGDVELFAEAYHAHGRIVTAPSADAARGRLVGDWLEAHERGERAVMIAHRRRDVADLNQRTRYALRELGHIGPDELVVGRRAFALGDRVVARRNDRRLGIVNGEAGLVAGIEDGCIAVELDGGRTVGLPEAYVRSGNLDHGYALTAHLAQGATVDRAYVLGSDELYREWGYTALSRHRAEARLYVSGTPAFLNRGDDAARSDVDVTGVVTGMLVGSRAQPLALEGVASEPRHDPLVSELGRARHELTYIDGQLEALRAARSGLRWYQRAARQELARRIDGWQRPRAHWLGEAERLARELDARPEALVPPLSRARDPLEQLRPVPTLERRRGHYRGLER